MDRNRWAVGGAGRRWAMVAAAPQIITTTPNAMDIIAIINIRCEVVSISMRWILSMLRMCCAADSCDSCGCAADVLRIAGDLSAAIRSISAALSDGLHSIKRGGQQN